MDVYDHIETNDRKTVGILFVFPAALFVIVFLIALLMVKTGIFSDVEIFHGLSSTGVLGPTMQLTMAVYPWMVSVAFIWIVVSYYMGDAMILGIAQARRVTYEENRDLFCLVEVTAMMAGLPTQIGRAHV